MTPPRYPNSKYLHVTDPLRLCTRCNTNVFYATSGRCVECCKEKGRRAAIKAAEQRRLNRPAQSLPAYADKSPRIDIEREKVMMKGCDYAD